MNEDLYARLSVEKNVWIATVRRDGRPHLTPVWFVLDEGLISICISRKSVKARNLSANSAVVLALEDGNKPVICEGTALPLDRPWPAQIQQKFKNKYDWDISTDEEYDLLVQITPVKWLNWG